MHLSAYENCLLLPDLTRNGSYRLYTLSKSESFADHSFVIIPYQDPQVKVIAPEFFKVTQVESLQSLPEATHISTGPVLKSRTPKENYINTVRDLKRHIQLGNIYEINYCVQFTAENVQIDPLTVFSRLYSLSKAPYAALVKMGDAFIISASPELFLEKKGDRIITKPIKGTIRRGTNAAEDEQLKNRLYNSLKERTENVMAVDVARNDLSRFAKKGTVQVNRLYNIETFETVHQMVSTVSCEPKDNMAFETLIDATFPMASMTGAPKLRAMQLIGDHEDFSRHYYSGAMGLIDEQGDFTLSVLIRSIFYNQAGKQLSIAVGGAITHLSDPESEYEECLLKANALLRALNATLAD